MELIKVKDVNNYKGRLYYIFPEIREGKIVRNKVKTFVQKEKATGLTFFGTFYCVPCSSAGVSWDNPIRCYHRGEVNDDSVVDKRFRFFTVKEEAEKALEDFGKQYAYKLTESIDRELKQFEAEKKKINEKIKELKAKKKECFDILSTSFTKKS
jgi:hypothetical protein